MESYFQSIYVNSESLGNKKIFLSIFRFNKEPEKTENNENNPHFSCRRSCRRNKEESDDLDFNIDLDDSEEDDNQID